MFALDFEGKPMGGTLLTPISMDRSLTEDFGIFQANWLLGPVEKFMIDLRELTKIIFFWYKGGCTSTTVKLVLDSSG